MIVEAAVDAGNDVLVVRGRADSGEEVHAFGWVTAISNHTEDHKTYRAMTAEEKSAYFLHLLEEQNPTVELTNLI